MAVVQDKGFAAFGSSYRKCISSSNDCSVLDKTADYHRCPRNCLGDWPVQRLKNREK